MTDEHKQKLYNIEKLSYSRLLTCWVLPTVGKLRSGGHERTLQLKARGSLALVAGRGCGLPGADQPSSSRTTGRAHGRRAAARGRGRCGQLHQPVRFVREMRGSLDGGCILYKMAARAGRMRARLHLCTVRHVRHVHAAAARARARYCQRPRSCGPRSGLRSRAVNLGCLGPWRAGALCACGGPVPGRPLHACVSGFACVSLLWIRWTLLLHCSLWIP